MEAGPRTIIGPFPWMQGCLHGGTSDFVGRSNNSSPSLQYVCLFPATTPPPLDRLFILKTPRWPSCNSSKTFSWPTLGTTTLLPQSTHPSCTESSYLLQLKGCISSSSKNLQPCRMSFCTRNKNGSRSVHLHISQAFTGCPCSISIIKTSSVALELRRLTQKVAFDLRHPHVRSCSLVCKK